MEREHRTAGSYTRYFYPRNMNSTLARALYAELLGTMLFTFLSTAGGNSPLSNGLSYAVLVYATQRISGGHLNPAVTFAVIASGLFHWVTGLLYIAAQLVGGVLGALLEALLVPGEHWGSRDAAACGVLRGDVSGGALFGWELVLTFTLIFVVYACAVDEPGHGSLSPLAVGLAAYVTSAVGNKYSGALLNPARLLGPAFVFSCGVWKRVPLYLLGEFTGALLAAVVCSSIFLFGKHRSSPYATGTTSVGEEPLLVAPIPPA